MAEANGIHQGPLDIAEDRTIAGIINGDVTIRPDCHVHLLGIVRGDVIVEPGGTATIAGIVAGRVIDKGGSVTITGLTAAGDFIRP